MHKGKQATGNWKKANLEVRQTRDKPANHTGHRAALRPTVSLEFVQQTREKVKGCAASWNSTFLAALLLTFVATAAAAAAAAAVVVALVAVEVAIVAAVVVIAAAAVAVLLLL